MAALIFLSIYLTMMGPCKPLGTVFLLKLYHFVETHMSSRLYRYICVMFVLLSVLMVAAY